MKTGKKTGDEDSHIQWRKVTGSRRTNDSSTSLAPLSHSAYNKEFGVIKGRKIPIAITPTDAVKKSGVNEGRKDKEAFEGRKKRGVIEGTYPGKPCSEAGAASNKKVTWADEEGIALTQAAVAHLEDPSPITRATDTSTNIFRRSSDTGSGTSGINKTYKEALLTPASTPSRDLRRPQRVYSFPSFKSPHKSFFKGKCFRCLGLNHWASSCREPLRCARCYKTGHVAKSCMDRLPMAVYREMRARPSYLSAFVPQTEDFFTRQNRCRNAILVGHFPQETLANRLASRFGGFPSDFHVAKFSQRDFVIFLPEWVTAAQLVRREILSLDNLRLRCYPWNPYFGLRRASLTYNVWIRLVSLPYECWSSRTVAALVGGFGRFIRADDFSTRMVDLTGYRCLISVNFLSDIPKNLEITVGDYSLSVLIQLERWGRREVVDPGVPPNERTEQFDPRQTDRDAPAARLVRFVAVNRPLVVRLTPTHLGIRLKSGTGGGKPLSPTLLCGVCSHPLQATSLGLVRWNRSGKERIDDRRKEWATVRNLKLPEADVALIKRCERGDVEGRRSIIATGEVERARSLIAGGVASKPLGKGKDLIMDLRSSHRMAEHFGYAMKDQRNFYCKRSTSCPEFGAISSSPGWGRTSSGLTPTWIRGLVLGSVGPFLISLGVDQPQLGPLELIFRLGHPSTTCLSGHSVFRLGHSFFRSGPRAGREGQELCGACGDESSGEEALSSAAAIVALGSFSRDQALSPAAAIVALGSFSRDQALSPATAIVALGSFSWDRDQGPVFTSKPASFVPLVPCGEEVLSRPPLPLLLVHLPRLGFGPIFASKPEEVLSPATAAVAPGSIARDWDLGPIFTSKSASFAPRVPEVFPIPREVEPLPGVYGGGVYQWSDPLGSVVVESKKFRSMV
uniref:CCHC-type domain-containing protein n=1 Tax=Ananas comosus var. bracteatus TaxID=296719 RepID=A0A6V7P6H5_ANACO|nr:unnamed protein product [Ananas comosus var. bracteatus]